MKVIVNINKFNIVNEENYTSFLNEIINAIMTF